MDKEYVDIETCMETYIYVHTVPTPLYYIYFYL